MAIRITRKTDRGLPLTDLPDRLMTPVIRVAPAASRSEREYQAFESWAVYARELQTVVHGHAQAVMTALGTSLADFLDMARSLPENRETPDLTNKD